MSMKCKYGTAKDCLKEGDKSMFLGKKCFRCFKITCERATRNYNTKKKMMIDKIKNMEKVPKKVANVHGTDKTANVKARKLAKIIVKSYIKPITENIIDFDAI